MAINEKILLGALNKSINSSEIAQLKTEINFPFTEEDAYMPNEIYHVCQKAGISLLFEKNILTTIHLFFNKKDGYNDFIGILGNNISSKNDNYFDVKSKFGEPSSSNIDHLIGENKIEQLWIRYDYTDYVVHYTFCENKEKISLITIMTKESAP